MAAELLTPQVTYLFDSAGRQAAEIAALPASDWLPAGNGIANFHYRDDVLWLRVELPAGQREIDSLFELRWPFYDSVQWYSFDSAGIHGPLLDLGDHLGMANRDLFSRFPVWSVPSHGGGVKWFLRLESGGLMLLPLYQWDVQTYLRQEQQTQLWLGLLFGTLLLMVVYNLGVWWQVRDASYLFYVGYVLAVMFYQASLYGVGYQYLWHDSAYLADKMLSLSVGCTFLFGALFFTYFLQLQQHRPLIHKLVLGLAVVYAVFSGSALFIAESNLVVLAQVVGAVVAISALVIAGLEWHRGNYLARYFTVAWLFLLLGTCIYTAALADLIPYNRFTEVVQTVGIVLELVLLSLALGSRIQQERVARKQAMELSLTLAQQVNQANQETIRVQEQAKFELEEKVIQRTHELENALHRLEHANASLARLSVTDALTGLKNRRYFSEQFAAEYQRALREQTPLSLLMFDLDHFKLVNDNHGHPAGDECIKQVAGVLLAHCRRPGDMAVRYGGEEMVLLLVSTDADGAISIAENIRKQIETEAVRHEGKSITVTTSIGVVTAIPSLDMHPEQWLSLADQALYEAKRRGRNQVVMTQIDTAAVQQGNVL